MAESHDGQPPEDSALQQYLRAMQACLNVPEALLAFVDSAGLCRAACVARNWQAAAKTPALWTHLAAARWPCTASKPLADAVRARGPREFFRAFVAAERPILPTFAPGPPLTPLNAFNEGTTSLSVYDFLFTLDVRQGDQVLCSVARGPFEVLREGFEADYFAAETRRYDGFIFDGLNASVDCRAGWFPPGLEPYNWDGPPIVEEDEEVMLTLCVVRRSDGHVSRFVPPTPLDGSYSSLGQESDGTRFFAANPGLSGGLPVYLTPPHQLGVRPPCGHPTWRGTQLMCTISIGNESEFPNVMTPETWSPPADPSVVVQADGYVLLRWISIYFMVGPNVMDEEHDAILNQEPFEDPYVGVELDAVVRMLDESLEFR